MNKEIAKEWCDALRSGEYQQGRGCLNLGGKYCCLGVLCELAKKKGVIENVFGEDKFPPKEVQEWAGLNTKNGVINDARSLTMFNDVDKLDFDEIAEIIEEHVEEL